MFTSTLFTYPPNPALFVWGHRGLPSEKVENTLECFAAGLRHRLDGVEFDVQVSLDGVPFIFHDDTLTRLVRVDSRAIDWRWADLKKLTLRDPARPALPPGRMCTLEELVNQAPVAWWLNLELKANPELGETEIRRVIQVLKGHGRVSRTLISSFDHDVLEVVARIEPQANLAALWDGVPGADALARALQWTRTMHIPWGSETGQIIERLLRLNCQTAVWGVQSAEDVAACYEMRANGVFIDDPNWLTGVRGLSS